MSKKIKIVLTVVAVIILAAVIGTIAYKNSNRKTLEIGIFAGSNWDVANANSFVIIDKAIDEFEAAHPNVNVHYYSGIRKDEYSEWFSRRLLQGKEPDVFIVLSEDFNQFAEIGVMKNLESLMMEDTDFDQEAFYKTALKSGRYLGNQYALPYETVPTLMLVNTTLLEREGIDVPSNDWTWEDFYGTSEKVTKDTDGDGLLDQFGSYNYGWQEAINSNGVELFDENGTESFFNDSRVFESIRFLKQLESLNCGIKVSRDDFDAGNVAFMPLSFAEYRTYKTYPYKIKRYQNFMWDCITLPAGPYGGNVSDVNTLLMGISANTDNEKLAWEFLKLMTYDEDIQMDIFRYSQGVSVLKNVTESAAASGVLQEDMEKSEKLIDSNLVSSIIENGVITPKFRKYSGALTMADNEINRVIDYDESIETSMRILQREINQYLRK